MAYVAISEAFINAVATHIEEMKNKELKAAPWVPEEPIQGTEDFILRPLWGDHLHLKDQLPERWKPKSKDLRLHFKITVNGKEMRCSKTLHSTFSVQLPPGTSAYWVDITVSDCSSPVMQALIANAQMEEEIRGRWKVVLSDIVSFFRSSKSVNEALKLWPQIEMYIPKEYMDRVNTKRTVDKEPSQAAKVLEKLDTDALTSAAVIARMSK